MGQIARSLGQGVRRTLVLLALTVLVMTGFFAFYSPSAMAATTLPTKMNFQGRLASSSGSIMANGTYNMRFRIYNAATGGALQWSEDRLVSASQGVTVTNGTFSVQLGSITSLPASVFTSNSLYFEVELPTPATATSTSPSWTEGAMTPRNQLATSAYAYNAETLDGIDSDAFAQLGTGGTFTANVGVNAASTTAFLVRNGGSNLFTVNTSASQVTIGSSDTTGALLVLDTKTDASDPTGSNGAMYYNSNLGKFRCYQADAWVDCVTATGAATTLQTAYDASSSPATITTSAAAKGVLIKAGTLADQISLFSVQGALTGTLFSVDSSNARVTIGSTTADGTGAVLVLDTKNSAGDPTGVDGAMYYNSSLAEFRCYASSNWRPCLSSSIANTSIPSGNTVANTTSEIVFASNYTIPANECRTGKIYRVTARGTYSTTTTAPTLTLRLKLGTITFLATAANTTTASMSGRQWTMNADMVCQSAPGATSAIEGQGVATRATSATAAVQMEMVGSQVTAVSTIAAQTLQASAQWGTASTSNTITLRQLVVDELSP